MDKLPSGYVYIPVPVPDNKFNSFRITGVKDKESVDAWVNEYSEETKTTWRKKRTFPKCGKFNVYKIEYRCCHNTDRRAKGTGPSKNTGCDATLTITINRFIENSKSKVATMQLVKSHPCLVKLYDKHNHDIYTESLKYRDLSPAVKEQLINLFNKGHNPASALKTYKTGLRLSLGEQYHVAAADGKTMPSYSVVHKLFRKEFPKKCRDISEAEVEGSLNKKERETITASNVLTLSIGRDIFYVAEDRTAEKDWFTPQHKLRSVHNPVCPQLLQNSVTAASSFNIDEEDRDVGEMLPLSSNASDGEVDEICTRITDFCNKIIAKVKENKEVFLPAAKKMLANSEKLTDTGLLTAMHTFGNYSGVKQNVHNKILQRSHKTLIRVQPTAIARRKGCVSGKKKITAASHMVLQTCV